jgi:hypothetical protein
MRHGPACPKAVITWSSEPKPPHGVVGGLAATRLMKAGQHEIED